MSKDFERTGFLFGANSVFIEELYQQYLNDPSSVDQSWIEFFSKQPDISPFKSTSKVIIKDLPKQESTRTDPKTLSDVENKLRAKFMITAYREHGHYLANLDPLGLEVKKTHAELELNIEDFGFSENNLSQNVDVTNELSDIKNCSVAELKEILERTYSGN